MGIFSKENKPKGSKPQNLPKEKKNLKNLTPQEVMEIFDINIKLALYISFYLKSGNATQAYIDMKKVLKVDVSHKTATCMGSRYLRKIREVEGFLDLVGWGWNEAIEAGEKLLVNNPGKYMDIWLKLNKEDTSRLEVDGPLQINVIAAPKS